jgi:hypothetical protein
MTNDEDSTDQVEPQSGGQNLRDVLMEIRSRRGVLTPEVVVEEASDPLHPLHSRFEWNNDEAAHKYRLLQAGQLLRVKYKQDIGDERVDLRAFWVTRDAAGAPTSTYEPMETILQDPIQRQLMLLQMRRDWQTFRRRYEHMQEFADEIRNDLGDDDGGTHKAG